MKKFAFIISSIIILTASHPWQGGRIAYLGDSITDPGTLRNDKHYWAYFRTGSVLKHMYMAEAVINGQIF